MNGNRIGADGTWPRVPKFDIPDLPPGGDQLVLDEEDERVLDRVWAQIRSRPVRVFDRTLPPLPNTAPEAAVRAHDLGQKALMSGEPDATDHDASHEAAPKTGTARRA